MPESNATGRLVSLAGPVGQRDRGWISQQYRVGCDGGRSHELRGGCGQRRSTRLRSSLVLGHRRNVYGMPRARSPSTSRRCIEALRARSCRLTGTGRRTATLERMSPHTLLSPFLTCQNYKTCFVHTTQHLRYTTPHYATRRERDTNMTRT